MKPFRTIIIQVISHNYQRYDTCGDWQTDGEGNWHIAVSNLDDPRYNFLVALHELVEMALCNERNITAEQVDAFDIGYEGRYPEDPGIDPEAPYHKEHMAATVIERDMARRLHVNWDKYNAVIDTLPEPKGTGEVK